MFYEFHDQRDGRIKLGELGNGVFGRTDKCGAAPSPLTMDAMGGPAWRRRFSREDDGDHGGGGDGDNDHLMMATFRVMAYR